MNGPLDVLLVRLRDGRWRARATGTGPDGRQLVVSHTSAHDRAGAVSEATIKWFAAVEGR